MRQFRIEACLLSLVLGIALAVSSEDEKAFHAARVENSKEAALHNAEEDFDADDLNAEDAEEDGKTGQVSVDFGIHENNETFMAKRKLQFAMPAGFPGIPTRGKGKCATVKDANGCGGKCPSDYIMALLPDPKGNTCPIAGWKIPFPAFKAFPGMGFMMERALEQGLKQIGMYMNAKSGKDAVFVKKCEGLVGLNEKLRYCIMKFDLSNILPKIGGKTLFRTNIAFCFVITPSLSPMVATAFSSLNFDFWPLPFSIAFTGVSVSLNGCLQVPTKAYLTTSGVVITGRKLPADMAISVAMSWGVSVPFFRLALVCRMKAFMSLDPRKDGKNVKPHDIMLSMFRQTCLDGPHPGTDWQFWFQTRISIELTIADKFVLTFPFQIHSQLFIDSDSKDTNIYLSFALTSINSLADILGSDYRKIQRLGGEKFACISLAFKTKLPTRLIPYCADFIFFKKSVSIYITYEAGRVAVALSFNEGAYTARIMRTDNGYSFCLNSMCQNNIGFTDNDCGDGYSKHNIGTNASWTCRRVQRACFCITHYSSQPFNNSCPGACYLDDMLHSTSDSTCRKFNRGGSAFCIDKPLKNSGKSSFCNKTKAGRRMGSWFNHKRRLTSKCPRSLRSLKVKCEDSAHGGKCSHFAGPSTCVRGTCRCRPGFCPSGDGKKCVAADDMQDDKEEILNSEEAQGRSGAVPGTLADLFVPKFAPDVNAHLVEDTEQGYRAKPKKTTKITIIKPKKPTKPTKGKKLKKSGTSGIHPTAEQKKDSRSLQALTRTTPKPKGKPVCKCGADLALILKLLVDDPTGMTTNPKSKTVMKDTLWNVLKKQPNNKVKRSDIKIQSVTTKTNRNRRLDAQGRRLAGTVTVAYTIENVASTVPKIDNNAMRQEVNTQSLANGVTARVTSASISEPPTSVNIQDDGSPTPESSYVGGGGEGAERTRDGVTTADGLEEEEVKGCALHASCALHWVIIITMILVGSFFAVIVAFKVKKARSRLANSVYEDDSEAKSRKSNQGDSDDGSNAGHKNNKVSVKAKASEVLGHMGINLDFGKGHDKGYDKDDRDEDKDKEMGGSDTVSTEAEPGNAKICDDMVKPEPEWGMPKNGKKKGGAGLFDAFTCGGPMCAVNEGNSQMRSLDARPAI